jgi:mRNA interferase MazF
MSYDPEQGDIVYLEFDPQAGHEQKGKRPAFIVSNPTFNQFAKLAMVCPITKTTRSFPLHIELDERTKTQGVIMCEKVKSLDITARGALYFEKAPKDILEEAIDIITSFVEEI